MMPATHFVLCCDSLDLSTIKTLSDLTGGENWHFCQRRAGTAQCAQLFFLGAIPRKEDVLGLAHDASVSEEMTQQSTRAFEGLRAKSTRLPERNDDRSVLGEY